MSVVEALGPMLREYGEILPLACSEAEQVIYNPTRAIDALDEEASSIMRVNNGGISRIVTIRKHVFRSEAQGLVLPKSLWKATSRDIDLQVSGVQLGNGVEVDWNRDPMTGRLF